MAHLGLLCPELTGHLNPLTTLGRELQRRGHTVTVVARPDAERKAQGAGLGFAPIAEADFPVGSINRTSAELGKLKGLAAIRYTAELLRQSTTTVLREAPAAITAAKMEALVVDQVTPAGNTVAETLGLPFVTVCNALAMNPDPALPPGVMPWKYRRGFFARLRNQFGHAVLRWLAKPIVREIDAHRARHGLRRLQQGFNEGSRLAQIAQQPSFFDYPRTALPECFHYTGPWHDSRSGGSIPFPWEKLDQRPLIYASMGTLQNRLHEIFRSIASACEGLPAQLVLSLGSADQKMDDALPGSPIVVPFAPQLELLQRASLSITHAGLNTALESLSHGVPMVAIPITNDQPAVASRLEWLGAAEVVPLGKLSVPRLRSAIERVLREPSYREKAKAFQAEIAHGSGVAKAADIVEQAFSTRQPVLRQNGSSHRQGAGAPPPRG
jgi:zeaxanthin glucosyltransferase